MKSFRIQKTNFGSWNQRRHLMVLLVLGGLAIWGVNAFMKHSHTTFVFHHGPLPAVMRVCSFWTERGSFDNLTEDSTTSALELHLQLFKHFYILGIGTRSEW
jgi:hypothetical protein